MCIHSEILISSKKMLPKLDTKGRGWDREHLGDFASAAETAGTATRGREAGRQEGRGGFHFRNERNVRSSEWTLAIVTNKGKRRPFLRLWVDGCMCETWTTSFCSNNTRENLFWLIQMVPKTTVSVIVGITSPTAKDHNSTKRLC